MTNAPTNARRPVNMTDYNIDPRGIEVTFGFRFTEGDDVHFQMHHENLTQVIGLLRAIAFEAAEVRFRHPETPRAEVEQMLNNPVIGVDFTPDSAGRTAILRAGLQTGAEGRLQLPYQLLVELQQGLPALLDEMRRRQEKAPAA